MPCAQGPVFARVKPRRRECHRLFPRGTPPRHVSSGEGPGVALAAGVPERAAGEGVDSLGYETLSPRPPGPSICSSRPGPQASPSLSRRLKVDAHAWLEKRSPAAGSRP